jgi:hypothetical protein
VEDWKSKLEGLSKNLQAEEQSVLEQKVTVLKGFRKRLSELEPIIKTAVEFGDAFGVDCSWEISRFDDRYPRMQFRILKPVLEYHVECRDGVITERLRGGMGPATARPVTLEALDPRAFEKRITEWVQAAANANRKVPGNRK